MTFGDFWYSRISRAGSPVTGAGTYPRSYNGGPALAAALQLVHLTTK